MKKLCFLGLTLTLSLALVSCSSNETTGGTPVTQTPSSSTATTDGETAGTEAAEADVSGTYTTVSAGSLIMATNAAFPPYEMVADDDGVAGTGYEGIDVEIAAAVAAEMGLTLEVSDMDFTAALAAPGLGKADIVMAGVTVNEDRLKNMDFSDTYATGVQVVIVKELSPIETLDDLEGMLIGTQEGTTGYIYASSDPEDGGYGEENVTALPNGAMAVESLMSGKVDCVIIDNEPAKSYVASNVGLRILDSEFAVEEYAIGMAKGNTALQEAINQALASLEAQGMIDEIVSKYINVE